jgi:hypothetical protein
MIHLYFNQSTIFVGDSELTFAKYPQYLSLFVALYLFLFIRITHLIVIFQCEPYYSFINTYVNNNS